MNGPRDHHVDQRPVAKKIGNIQLQELFAGNRKKWMKGLCPRF